jgi:hypothetical protein
MVGEQPMVVELLATLTNGQRYPFVASLRRFTYSQSRFVMLDGGIGPLPNTDSSESMHPLKLTAYPPNGTLFVGLPFLLALTIAPPSS